MTQAKLLPPIKEVTITFTGEDAILTRNSLLARAALFDGLADQQASNLHLWRGKDLAEARREAEYTKDTAGRLRRIADLFPNPEGIQ